MGSENSSTYFWQWGKVRLRPLTMQDWEIWCRESEDSEGIRLLQWGIELPKSESMAKAWVEQYVDCKDTSKRQVCTSLAPSALHGPHPLPCLHNHSFDEILCVRAFRPVIVQGHDGYAKITA